MDITVRGKHLDVTNSLREYVEKRVGKLERFFDVPLAAQVTLSVQKDRQTVEVTMPVGGVVLRGEVSTGDMYSSIDMVVEKLEKQIDKYKTRITKRFRVAAEAGGALLEAEPGVVRTKRLALKPISVDEAIMRLNLVGHDFFVFTNEATGDVNVLYRRKDGDYGLLQPES
ncbi:MAG: ribosome hibernation-promoting factor, HPF/YfiA family [Symbiobacteriia bacterium]